MDKKTEVAVNKNMDALIKMFNAKDVPQDLTTLSMFITGYIEMIGMDVEVFCEGMRECVKLAQTPDEGEMVH